MPSRIIASVLSFLLAVGPLAPALAADFPFIVRNTTTENLIEIPNDMVINDAGTLITIKVALDLQPDGFTLNSDAAGSGADWTYDLTRPTSGMVDHVNFIFPPTGNTAGLALITDGGVGSNPEVITADWAVLDISTGTNFAVDTDFFNLNDDTLEFSTNFGNNGGIIGIFNGMIIEHITTVLSSNGSTILFTIEADGGGDLTVFFSSGYVTIDTTPALAITLTAGSDTSPTENFIYVLESTGLVTVSTSGFPAAGIEFAHIATVVVQSAGTVQTDGGLSNHAHSNPAFFDFGHLQHISEWIREQHSTYESGIAQTFTINSGPSPDTVFLDTTAGFAFQLHSWDVPAFDMSGATDVLYVVNDPVTPYLQVTDIADIVTDSLGGSLLGRYYTLVFWVSVSQNTAESKFFVTLPGGSYNQETLAIADSSRFANFQIPIDFQGAAILVAEWILRQQAAGGGTHTSILEIDLRGQFPSTAAGGGSTLAETEFTDSAFAIFNVLDSTKDAHFDASNISTGTVRTFTFPDADGTLALTSDLHSAVTLSGTPDYITLSGQDIIRGTVDISDDTNLSGDAEIVLTDDALSIAASIARDSELHSAVTVSGARDYFTLVGQDLVRGVVDISDDTNLAAASGIVLSGDQVAFDYTATLAGNPTMGAGEAVFGTTGLIFEGATANLLEGLLTVVDPTADRTWTLPDATGTIALSSDILDWLRADIADTAVGEIDFTAGVEFDVWQSLAGLGVATVSGNDVTFADIVIATGRFRTDLLDSTGTLGIRTGASGGIFADFGNQFIWRDRDDGFSTIATLDSVTGDFATKGDIAVATGKITAGAGTAGIAIGAGDIYATDDGEFDGFLTANSMSIGNDVDPGAYNLVIGVEDANGGSALLTGTATTFGGFLRLDIAADSDTTHNYWGFLPTNTDLFIGPDTDTNAFVFQTDGDLQLTAGRLDIDGTGVNDLEGSLEVALTSTFTGEADFLGGWEGDTWQSLAGLGVATVSGNDVTFADALNTSGITSLSTTIGSVIIGTNDTVVGGVAIRGGSGSNGAFVSWFNGALDDTTVDLWQLRASGLDFLIGPDTDFNAFTFEDDGDLNLTAGRLNIDGTGINDLEGSLEVALTSTFTGETDHLGGIEFDTWQNLAGSAIASISAQVVTFVDDVAADAVILSDLTATRIMATDGASKSVSVADLTSWIAGTANEITVTDDADGTVTIDIPDSPEIGGLMGGWRQGFHFANGAQTADGYMFSPDATRTETGRILGYPMLRAGSITGLSIRSSDLGGSHSADGTVTLEARINDVAVLELTTPTITSALEVQATFTQARNTSGDTFSAGDTLELFIDFNAFAGSLNSVAYVEVVFDD